MGASITRDKIKSVIIESILETNVLEMHAADLSSISPSLFKRDLTNLYEIEYKLSIIYRALSNPTLFNGHPKRLESIARLYKRKALDHVHVIATVFEHVFNQWLESHAISDPEKWAEVRARDSYNDLIEMYTTGMSDDGCIFDQAISEYNLRHQNYGYGKRALELDDILSIMIRKDIFPSKTPNMVSLLGEICQLIEDDLNAQYEDEMSMWPGNQIEDDDADNIIEPDPDAFDDDTLDDDENKPTKPMRYADDPAEFLHRYVFDSGTLENKDITDQWFYSTYAEGAIKEMYLYMVWPIWWATFKPQGIVNTRKRIENAHKELVSMINQREYSKDMIARLNIIKNISHQSGGMIDYIQEWVDETPDPDSDSYSNYWEKYSVKEVFDDLSGIDEDAVSDWSSEMQQLGFDV